MGRLEGTGALTRHELRDYIVIQGLYLKTISTDIFKMLTPNKYLLSFVVNPFT